MQVLQIELMLKWFKLRKVMVQGYYWWSVGRWKTLFVLNAETLTDGQRLQRAGLFRL